MIGLLVFAALVGSLLYAFGTFVVANSVQDWMFRKGLRFDVAIPSMVHITLLIILPISILAQLAT